MQRVLRQAGVPPQRSWALPSPAIWFGVPIGASVCRPEPGSRPAAGHPEADGLDQGENGTILGRRNPGPEQPTPEVDTGLSLGVVGPVDLVDDSDDLGK